MAQTIQFRRGNEANLPSLQPGEPAVTLDTDKLFVGGPNGNVELPKKGDVDTLASSLAQKAPKKKTDTWVDVKEDFGAKGDGVTDDTQSIQNAIDYLGSVGGKVILPTGKYIVSTLKLGSYITLEGQGFQSTLKLANGINNFANVLELKLPSSQMVTLRNFRIDGNSYNNPTGGCGIYFENQYTSLAPTSLYDEIDSRHIIENVYVFRTKGDGVVLKGRGESQVKSLQILQCDGNGFVSECYDNWYDSISVGASGLKGIVQTLNGSCRYNNCKSWMNGRLNNSFGYGYLIESKNNTISGCEAQDNHNHGFYISGEQNSAVGILSEANGYDFTNNVKVSGVCGVYLTGSYNTVMGIVGDRFSPSHSEIAVHLGGSGNIVDLSCRNHTGLAISETATTNSNFYRILSKRADGAEEFISNNDKLVRLAINTSPNTNLPLQVKTEESKGHAYPALFTQKSDAQNVLARFEKQNNAGTVISRWQLETDNTNKNLKIYDNLVGVNKVELTGGLQLSGKWNAKQCLEMNGNFLWVDSTGKLRIKNSQPTSDTDGIIVGTQT